MIHEVIDGLEVLICGIDERGTILVFNLPCERLTGVARDCALGTSWLDLFARGERRDHILELWQLATVGQPAGPYEALFRNGRSLRWQFARWDQSFPAPLKIWAVGIDITDEREALAQARQLDRIMTLGNLVSGLTHELRNPLNGALLQLALAERYEARSRAGAPTALTQTIAQATVEVRRISTLLDDFLVFMRPLPVRLERSDVRPVVERAIKRAEPKALAAAVTVTLEPGEEARAEIDVVRVEAAVYQLLANAIDAATQAPTPDARVRIELRGNAIAIEVEDHGPGLPSGDARIFEPFFTTKQGGSGLGLAIVERVAADHGGTIDHERRGGATVFRLKLPIVGGASP